MDRRKKNNKNCMILHCKNAEMAIFYFIFFKSCSFYTLKEINQRTNGPVNAHLISWPSKAHNIQNLENIWKRNDLDIQYSHTFIISISCLHLPTFRSQAAIVSEKSTVFTFSHRKA